MSVEILSHPDAPAARPPDLFDFFERVRTTNPFLVNRVDRPLDPSLIDVGDIHEAAFERVLGLGRQAAEDNRGIGVVVWGEAGVGKTHLLSRLARWAADTQAACPVYLHNLQASPERLPRYVLRSALHVLTRGQVRPFYASPLFVLMNSALMRQGMTRGTWGQIEAAHAALVRRFAARDPSGGVLFDRTVHEVLFRFYRHAHPNERGAGEDVAGLAVRWLSGDALDPAEARRLGLPTQANADEPVALADNQQVKQVLVALTQLAHAAGQLFLLCLDQVDNLDEEQVRGLSRFLHDLLDSAGNLLSVTTGVKATLVGFQRRGVITETSWDRIGQFELDLGRLRREQGYALVRARLLRFLEPFRGLKEVEERLRDDPLFPLGVAWFDNRLRDLVDFRPRDLLGWACARWQQRQQELNSNPGEAWLESVAAEGAPRPPEVPAEDPQAALDRAVAERVAEHQARCVREPGALPVDGDRLLELLDAALRQCQGGPYRLRSFRRFPPPKSGPRGPYDLLIEQEMDPPQHIGVRVLVAEHARTVTTALERIAEDEERPERVLLVSDERQESQPGPKGRELLAELEEGGPQAFRQVKLSLRQLAELDALQAVIRSARGGDLEVETAASRRPVSEDEVIASHRRAGRYLANPLLRELLGGAANPAAPREPEERQALVGQTAESEPLS